MNIVMMTNTYLPHTGGVARSVEWFREALRRRDHQVLVVAPTFAEMPAQEQDVVRVPAVQNFNGSDFSVRLPTPGLLRTALEGWEADIVHAHHPFLLGDTALRVAAWRNLPIVFTHHTMYEQYTRYVPGDSPAMQRFAIRLATEFANLCDRVIAPSESIAQILRDRGVTTEITAIPTGIHAEHFARGNGRVLRRRYEIPDHAFVVGHVGRLAPEKNLPFLARAVCHFLRARPDARFLLVGQGPSLDEIAKIFSDCQLANRLHYSGGVLQGEQLADAYHAMDVFAFASHSETQGMVLAEAMTAGVPVVAVDAPGAREIVHDAENGTLLPDDNEKAFARALDWYAGQSQGKRHEISEAARRTARDFAMPTCARRLEAVYQQAMANPTRRGPRDDSDWASAIRLIGEEWKRLAGMTSAVGDALFGSESTLSLPNEPS